MSQGPEKNTGEEIPPTLITNVQIQALMGEMKRIMRVELEHLHERLDRVEEGTPQIKPPPNAPRKNMMPRKEVEDNGEFEGENLEDEMALASWLVLATVLLAQVFTATLHILSRVIMKDRTFVYALITYRNAASALSIAPLAYYFERSTEKKFGYAVCFWLFVSAAIVISDSAFYYYGLHDTTATFATNLYNLIPIFTFLLSLITRTEKLDLRTRQGKIKTFGVLLSLVGALVASLNKGKELYVVYHHQHGDSHTATTQNSHDHWVRGATLIIASCLSRALWFIVQRKLLAVFSFKYTAIMLQSGITSMQSAVIGLCLDRHVAAWKLGWNLELLAIVCSGTLYSAATFCLLSWVISILGPTYPSMFNPVGLIFVTVTEALLLGEAIRVGSLVGMILILAGLCSFLWGAKKKEDGESELTTQLMQGT
ncbi:WAT1-related protein At5g64700-like [Morus notabilis]|uniref:WAT1-related protein At5g64700-like n=1 Tax=Morus notabilis TaxID=981085 RepID=UPI000CED2F57|nr:WAT1-related protein At5g64700-like [Morus notabilis]